MLVICLIRRWCLISPDSLFAVILKYSGDYRGGSSSNGRDVMKVPDEEGIPSAEIAVLLNRGVGQDGHFVMTPGPTNCFLALLKHGEVLLMVYYHH